MSEDRLPRDLQQYFDVPRMTHYSVTGTSILVARANPDRIGLIFSNPGSGRITLGTSAALSSQVGYQISQDGGSLMLRHHDWGNLVQVEWYAFSFATSDLTVFETFLPRSPIDR